MIERWLCELYSEHIPVGFGIKSHIDPSTPAILRPSGIEIMLCDFLQVQIAIGERVPDGRAAGVARVRHL